jgi:hypothetical protein
VAATYTEADAGEKEFMIARDLDPTAWLFDLGARLADTFAGSQHALDAALARECLPTRPVAWVLQYPNPGWRLGR